MKATRARRRCGLGQHVAHSNLEESELTVLQESLRRQELLWNAEEEEASISQLEAQVSTLSTLFAQVSTLTRQVEGLLKEKANHVYSFNEEDRFSSASMQMCIRSFVDHIVSAVYLRIGLVGVNANTGLPYTDFDVADWLQSGEADAFFRGGHSITLFDGEVALDVAFLAVLQSFKSIPSTISRQHMHTTTPVLVVAALSNLLYEEEDDIAKIFKRLFQYSFTDVVKRHEAGYVTKKEASRFEKRFSSRS